MITQARTLLFTSLLFFMTVFAINRFTTAQASTPQADSPAIYRVTFTSNWNNDAHPALTLPGSAHWSNLVGATHNDAVTFWQVGGLATPGIERVAESGTNATFQAEVTAATEANTADQWIQTGLTPFYAPDSTATITLTVQPEFPLLTLATMLAPSPDWFTGVSNLALQDEAGAWVDSFTLDLYPYDAGTEDGSGYSLSNPATVPAVPIAPLRNVSPFSAEPIATLTVTRLSAEPTPSNTLYLPTILR